MSHTCQLERKQGHSYGLLHSKEMPTPPHGSYCSLLLYMPCCSSHGLTPHLNKCVHVEMFLILLSLIPVVEGEVISFVWCIMVC